MLRGPQTPGELRLRSERLHSFEKPGALDSSLERLAEAGLVERLDRLPGQKEARFRHLLGNDAALAVGPAPAEAVAPPDPPLPSDDRLERLEAEVAQLRADFDELRRELGA